MHCSHWSCSFVLLFILLFNMKLPTFHSSLFRLKFDITVFLCSLFLLPFDTIDHVTFALSCNEIRFRLIGYENPSAKEFSLQNICRVFFFPFFVVAFVLSLSLLLSLFILIYRLLYYYEHGIFIYLLWIQISISILTKHTFRYKRILFLRFFSYRVTSVCFFNDFFYVDHVKHHFLICPSMAIFCTTIFMSSILKNTFKFW